MRNLQPIAKQELDSIGLLSVHHIFPTIQGEGPFSGNRAIFIRLAGCNLQCPDCDTDYTSLGTRKSLQQKLSPLQIVAEVSELAPSPYVVVITGGEPFRQNIGPVIVELIEAGYYVQVETNGTLFVDIWAGMPDEYSKRLTIVCSPKTGKINPQLAPHITEYKYVLSADEIDDEDGLPTLALHHPANPRVARPPPEFEGDVYIQPADAEDEIENRRNAEACVRSCKRFGYILSLQLHKILGLE